MARLAALCIVPALLFGPILSSGQVFLPFLPAGLQPLAGENPIAAAEAMRAGNWTMGDRVFPFLTDQIAAQAELWNGALPTWEPGEALGLPLFGGTIGGLAYPPNVLALLSLPMERAAAPLALLALFLAGLGMALFLRRVGLDPRAALFGALAYQLGGWGLANLFYYMKVDAALWFPWALWAVEGRLAGRRWSGLALVLALTCSFLGGMVTVSIFVFAATAAYALLRGASARGPGGERLPGRARFAGLLGTGVLLVLGVAGAAFQLLPLDEAGKASLRDEQTPAETIATSLPITTALGILVPDLLGPPTDPTPQGNLPLAWWLAPAEDHERAELANALEWNTYALVPAALLALVALVATPRRAALPACFLLLTFAFAQAWPPLRWSYSLPGSGLGAAGRVLCLAWALWPWLAALGLDALLARAPRALPALLAAALVAALGLFVAWRSLEPAGFAQELERTIVERYDQTVEAVRARIPPENALGAGRHLRESLGRAFSSALAVLACGVLALVLDRRRPRFEHGPALGTLALAGVVPLGLACLPLALGEGAGERGPLALLGLSAVLTLAALCGKAGAAAPDGARSELALWFPLLAVLVVEGFLGSLGHVQGRSILGGGLFPFSPSIEAVREAAGDARVLRLDRSPSGLAEVVELARPNLLVPYGIRELTPYPTFTPRQLTELFTRLDPSAFYRNHVSHLSSVEKLDHPLLDLLRVGALLSVAPVQHPRLVPILERPGFCVYRRLGALPEARIVPDAIPSADDEQVLAALLAPDADYSAATRIAPEHADELPESVTIPSWKPGTITAVEHPSKNRVVVRIQGSLGGWLVLHEQWARGWEASIDGQPARVWRADHAYRAVQLSAGENLTVEFRYRPPSLEWGAALSLVALLGVLAFELLNHPRS